MNKLKTAVGWFVWNSPSKPQSRFIVCAHWRTLEWNAGKILYFRQNVNPHRGAEMSRMYSLCHCWQRRLEWKYRQIVQIKEPIRTRLIPLAKHGKIGITRLAFALTLDWLIKWWETFQSIPTIRYPNAQLIVRGGVNKMVAIGTQNWPTNIFHSSIHILL